MAVDPAFAKYGYIADLADAIPELRKLLNDALAQGQTPAAFSQAVQDSNWWKNSGTAYKQTQILRVTQPGEYAKQLANMTAKVAGFAGKMGVTLGVRGLGNAQQVALAAMTNGWDDTHIQGHIGQEYQAGTPSLGQAGATIQQLRQIWADYGLPPDNNNIISMTRQVLSGDGDIPGYQHQAQEAAKSRYAGLAAQIDAGQTVRQIADPYIQTVASTLELNPNQVGLTNPYVQRALTARDPKGAPTVQPLWQVEDAAKQDPRYDGTKQAINGAYAALTSIGQDLGFK